MTMLSHHANEWNIFREVTVQCDSKYSFGIHSTDKRIRKPVFYRPCEAENTAGQKASHVKVHSSATAELSAFAGSSSYPCLLYRRHPAGPTFDAH